jgi:glycine cleavage system H protein
VVEVNTDLPGAPETVNSMPEKDGWFAKLKLSNPAELDGLMDRAAYEQFLSTL